MGGRASRAVEAVFGVDRRDHVVPSHRAEPAAGPGQAAHQRVRLPGRLRGRHRRAPSHQRRTDSPGGRHRRGDNVGPTVPVSVRRAPPVRLNAESQPLHPAENPSTRWTAPDWALGFRGCRLRIGWVVASVRCRTIMRATEYISGGTSIRDYGRSRAHPEHIADSLGRFWGVRDVASLGVSAGRRHVLLSQVSDVSTHDSLSSLRFACATSAQKPARRHVHDEQSPRPPGMAQPRSREQ